MKFARFQTGATIRYGIVEGENVREIRADLFEVEVSNVGVLRHPVMREKEQAAGRERA